MSGIGRLRLLLGCPAEEIGVDSTDMEETGDNHGELGDYYFDTDDGYFLY